MKKLFLLVAIVLSSVVAVAQTNQVVWVNGRAVLGQSINQVDSLKFGEMGGDTLHLILPYAAIIRDTVFVHDTVYIKDRAPLGVEIVDLGLSVKWASCNIGATKPEEYGDYFAWGETSPKTNYDWSTYKWMAADQSSWEYINKYTCPDNQTSASWYSGGTFIGDNKTTLEAEDDAAHVNWGGNWRMPTHAEQEELIENCTITWTDDYKGTGVAGRIFTSNKTGYTDKSIFLPGAGCRHDASLSNVGPYGYYWSSSLSGSYSFRAWKLHFYSGYVYSYDIYRYYGHSVRAVCP